MILESLSNTPDATMSSPVEDKEQALPLDPEAKLLLFFPLKEKYEELSFALLMGRDRMIAQLFRSLSFLDVHLAFVTQMVDGNMDPLADWEQPCDWTKRTFKVVNWIGSRNSLPLSKKIVLDAKTQLLGKVNHIQDVFYEPIGEVLFCHAALVIQPKTQTVLHACRYQLDAVLDYLEFHASEIKKMPATFRPSACKQPLAILRQVTLYCYNNPLQAWKYPEINQRSQRLLELCLIFKAKQEGLKLLESMGNEMIPNSPTSQNNIPNMFVEGIRDDLVAKAVADFVTQISGNYLHF